MCIDACSEYLLNNKSPSSASITTANNLSLLDQNVNIKPAVPKHEQIKEIVNSNKTDHMTQSTSDTDEKKAEINDFSVFGFLN